jgi:hypothetical protein
MMGRVPLQIVTRFFRAFALLLGGLHTWAAITSHSMNADGISYLDIGDAYLRGDWITAINAVWSPLYSWILGLVMAMVKPSMAWEFPLVHVVNFAIYFGSLFSFEYFWRQARITQQERLTPGFVTLPDWAWWMVGYLFFIWVSLTLIEVWAVTPDMLMSALVYLASGQLLRLQRGETRTQPFLLLGAFLGLGYLSKAIMFPISFVFLGVALISAWNGRQTMLRGLAGVAIFGLITLPFILLISNKTGRFTFGEAGSITYVRYVNGVTYPHWQGKPADNGTPIHPSRPVFDTPPIYEFGTPIFSTYPISLNPIYWYEGVEAHVDFAQQLRLLTASGLFYADLFFRQLGGVIAGIFGLYLVAEWKKASLIEMIRGWSLAIPALVGFALYALVLVEGRYIGVFVILFLAPLLGNLTFPKTSLVQRLAAGIAGFIAFVLLVNLGIFNLQGWADLDRNQGPQTFASHSPRWPGEVAEELHRLGVQPGDPVGVIGYAFDSYWARLAHVRIVAEMLDVDADPFWRGDAALQAAALEAFANAGAKAVIAEYVPSLATLTGWHQVGDSNYYIYLSP